MSHVCNIINLHLLLNVSIIRSILPHIHFTSHNMININEVEVGFGAQRGGAIGVVGAAVCGAVGAVVIGEVIKVDW